MVAALVRVFGLVPFHVWHAIIFRSGSTGYCHSLTSRRYFLFFFSSRRRHTRCLSDWSSDVCSSDLTCYEALAASWKEAERLRAIDHREVGAPERFRDFFGRLALEHETLSPDLASVLIEAHKAELSRAASFPPHYDPLLRRMARHYRLAVVSNFDYTPTATGILEAAGVLDLFAAVIVSDAVGWRKPRPDIFRTALVATGADPARTLFVGDRADIDVEGAHRVGMDAAWINPMRDPLPEGVAPPEYEIRDLADLEPILGLR